MKATSKEMKNSIQLSNVPVAQTYGIYIYKYKYIHIYLLVTDGV